MQFYAWMLFYAILDVCANWALLGWLRATDARNKAIYLTLALVLYLGCGAAWAESLLHKDFHTAQLLYAPVACICGLVVVGVTDSTQLTPRTILACCLALAACLLLEA